MSLDLHEIVRLREQDKLTIQAIADQFGVNKSTISRFLNKKTNPEFWESKPLASGTTIAPNSQRKKLQGKRFAFVAAQNNTYVHKGFLEALHTYCEHDDASLIVGTMHYNKNAYSKKDEQDDKCWFDPAIEDFIMDEPLTVAEGLVWCGELDVSPTIAKPLSRFGTYTRSNSGIIPHAKVQLDSLPTPKYDTAKMMYTTGCVTQINYIQRTAGQAASFDHVFGALIVEVDEDGDWFAFQVMAESKTGNFYHHDKYYTSGGVTSGHRLKGLNHGDLHGVSVCPDVAFTSWGKDNPDNIVDTLRPEYQFCHDTLSFDYRNHHNIKNPLFRFKQFARGKESVRREMELTCELLEDLKRDDCQLVVVDSNHDRALQKWIIESDFKQDPVNSVFMLELSLALYKAVEDGEDFHMFEFASRMVSEDMCDVEFLREDESFRICGIECGSHGDSGNNGARGGVASFAKQSVKHNIGHGHACFILGGVFQAGMAGGLDQGYNKGGSSWSNSGIFTYPNGKRSIFTIKNRKWRA
jgi:hypothetical protein